jgi:hypothetical protein
MHFVEGRPRPDRYRETPIHRANTYPKVASGAVCRSVAPVLEGNAPCAIQVDQCSWQVAEKPPTLQRGSHHCCAGRCNEMATIRPSDDGGASEGFQFCRRVCAIFPCAICEPVFSELLLILPIRCGFSGGRFGNLRLASIEGSSSAEVCMEEGCNTASRIHRGWLVVGNSGEAQHFKPELLFVVHEGMSGIRVFLHIVGNKGTG